MQQILLWLLIVSFLILYTYLEAQHDISVSVRILCNSSLRKNSKFEVRLLQSLCLILLFLEQIIPQCVCVCLKVPQKLSTPAVPFLFTLTRDGFPRIIIIILLPCVIDKVKNKWPSTQKHAQITYMWRTSKQRDLSGICYQTQSQADLKVEINQKLHVASVVFQSDLNGFLTFSR